jgi:hypothetical protein
MIELRKAKGRGIGFKRDPDKKPSRLRRVSKKQAKRNRALKGKLGEILAIQHELYGTERCEAGAQGWKPGCFDTLVLDHVETRNGVDSDRYENLQVLCVAHNGLKGSVRGLDFRPKEMVERMKELDKG